VISGLVLLPGGWHYPCCPIPAEQVLPQFSRADVNLESIGLVVLAMDVAIIGLCNTLGRWQGRLTIHSSRSRFALGSYRRES